MNDPIPESRIAIVLKGYPRLSETFIAQEILELERAGFRVDIVSLRQPTDKHTHPVHDEIKAESNYLPEYLHHEPVRVCKALANCISKPGFWKAILVFVKDLLRDPTPNRIRRFGQALVFANEYASNYAMIYVHFLHTPASVARYAKILSGKRFAISAHAKDIWTIPKWEIREKLADAEWLVTCTEGGAEYLASLAPEGKVHLVYHGIDLSRFPVPTVGPSQRDGSSDDKAVQLITVGRAVAKKGLDTLLGALNRLPDDFYWNWTHIGGGPLRESLIAQSVELGIGHRCTFLGALPQSEVIKAYRKSDIFILPCRVEKSGDRDGLPNVIVEAQSQRLAVVSTDISGIPELIENGENGLLIKPDNIDELAGAIEALARDPERRNQMGVKGLAKVRDGFSHKQTIGQLIRLLNSTLEKTDG